mmetsp:Transcript_30129/g.75844  ORF Transcript_30129/g.75844 Transcript_30129/m.75844 type:complete len:200 (-) Transcript_30129:604-1203(-)
MTPSAYELDAVMLGPCIPGTPTIPSPTSAVAGSGWRQSALWPRRWPACHWCAALAGVLEALQKAERTRVSLAGWWCLAAEAEPLLAAPPCWRPIADTLLPEEPPLDAAPPLPALLLSLLGALGCGVVGQDWGEEAEGTMVGEGLLLGGVEMLSCAGDTWLPACWAFSRRSWSFFWAAYLARIDFLAFLKGAVTAGWTDM